MDVISGIILGLFCTFIVLIGAIGLWYRGIVIRTERTIASAPILRGNVKSNTITDLTSNSAVVSHLVVDQDKASKLCPHLSIAGIGSYFDALIIPETDSNSHSFALEEHALTLLLKHVGGRSLLPLITFLPQMIRTRLVSLRALFEIIPNAMTVVTLIGIFSAYQARMAQLMASSSTEKSEKSIEDSSDATPEKIYTPLEILEAGEQPSSDESKRIPELSNPFVISESLEEIVSVMNLGDSPDECQQVPEPKLLANGLLPDLYLGDGCLKYLDTPREYARTRIICVLLNKLAHNVTLIGKARSGMDKKPFGVQVTKESAVCYEVGEFISSLQELKHVVKVRFASDVTSFGASFCMKNRVEIDGASVENQEWTYLAVGCPFRTGVHTVSDGKPEEIVTLLPHVCLEVKINGPNVNLNTGIQAYQGTEGFTGFMVGQDVDRAWQNSRTVYVSHGDDEMSERDNIRAMRLMALSSAVSNLMASDASLPFGGYLSLGTCVDSIALVQQALLGRTSMYPIMLHGVFRSHLLFCIQKLRQTILSELESLSLSSSQSTVMNVESMKRVKLELMSLARALLDLPSDLTVEPSDTVYACERIIATLPSESPFAVAEKAISQATHVLNHYLKVIQMTNESEVDPEIKESKVPNAFISTETNAIGTNNGMESESTVTIPLLNGNQTELHVTEDQLMNAALTLSSSDEETAENDH